jgi:hypothetical protein
MKPIDFILINNWKYIGEALIFSTFNHVTYTLCLPPPIKGLIQAVPRYIVKMRFSHSNNARTVGVCVRIYIYVYITN